MSIYNLIDEDEICRSAPYPAPNPPECRKIEHIFRPIAQFERDFGEISAQMS